MADELPADDSIKIYWEKMLRVEALADMRPVPLQEMGQLICECVAHYGDPRVHMVAASAYDRAEMPARAAWHRMRAAEMGW